MTADLSNMKRTDEKFQQFFWNNFVQEDGTLFYIHVGSTESASVQASNSSAHKTLDVRDEAVLQVAEQNALIIHA